MKDPLKALGALGFAMKAGRVRSGEVAAEAAIKAGKAKLLLLDSRASDNAKRCWTLLCTAREVPLITLPGVGAAIGREAHNAAAVTDAGFARMIIEKYNGEQS